MDYLEIGGQPFHIIDSYAKWMEHGTVIARSGRVSIPPKSLDV